MSLDKSLKSRGRLARRRNVLSRTERLAKLSDDEQWVEGEDSVFGLPKVKVARAKAPKAASRPEEVQAEEAAGAEPGGATESSED